MKRLLPALLLFLFILAACKKEKPAPVPPPDNKPPEVTTGNPVITSISPSSGLPNAVVTIKGSNFGTAADDLMVFFSGVKATIQSATSTEIKALVPVTTSGNIMVVKNNQAATGPSFSYIAPELNAAYVSGDVTLNSQAEIDLFVTLNKGRKLQITGSLSLGGKDLYNSRENDITSLAGLSLITSVSGQIFFNKINLAEAPFLNSVTEAGSINIYSSSFSTLSFNQLNAFSGSLTLNGLSQLNQLNIKTSSTVASISISSCPLLTDLSFLNNVSYASQISVSTTAAASVIMDKLTTVGASISISGQNLTSASFNALTIVGSAVPTGNLTLNYSPLLSDVNCKALTRVGGKLSVRRLAIIDMSGFSALESLGSLQVEGNPSLIDLHGLEHLINLTSAAVSSGTLGSASPISRVNGIYIGNNTKLASLNGLQNVSSIPISYIADNPALDDICPFKTSILALSKLPAYSFTYRNNIDQYINSSIAALTMTKNSNYSTTESALDAVALCK